MTKLLDFLKQVLATVVFHPVVYRRLVEASVQYKRH